MQNLTLKSVSIPTPIGEMLAIGSYEYLYLLKFTSAKNLQATTKNLQKKLNCKISPGKTRTTESITRELKAYFARRIEKFTTPISLTGSHFQKLAWQALCDIPYANTKSYAQQAQTIGKPTAFRAVANANASNKFSIIVPCHRIITSQGKLGGFAGGVDKKWWLLYHENPLLKKNNFGYAD